MGDLWTPPRGFFPGALSWFHSGNVDRFEDLLHADSECSFIHTPASIQNFVPGCLVGLIGHRIHFWKDIPPSFEFWAEITGCSGADYLLDSGPGVSSYDGNMTISTNVAATIQSFANPNLSLGAPEPPYAIRYGWCFSAQAIDWWRHNGYAMHWLGPP